VKATTVSAAFKTGIILSALAMLAGIFACMDVPRVYREPSVPPPLFRRQPLIKVLIDRAPRFTIAAEGPCRFAVPGEEKGNRIPPFPAARVSGRVWVKRDSLRLPGIEREGIRRIDVVPVEAGTGVAVDGTTYFGTVRFIRAGTEVLAVNILPLETYIRGVILGELGANAPVEAMKAQAVAARNYALYEYKTRSREPYHVKRTVHSQVFIPRRRYPPRVERAAAETAGVIMLYNNKLFKAYYSATCGGRTANVEEVWNCLPQVPLSSVTCGFCTGAPGSVWRFSITRSQLKRRLRHAGFRLDYVKRVYVPPRGRGSSGRVRYVRIEIDQRHHHGLILLSGMRLRRILPAGALKSTWFSVSQEGEKITFAGKGTGHGVGLCQNGAIGMAKAGYTFKDILTRYYTGVSFIRIY